MAPYRNASEPAAAVLGLASSAPTVLLAWLQIASGLNWLLLCFVLALMLLDGAAGALRAEVKPDEMYDPARDFAGLKTRAAYMLMIAGAFVVDGALLTASSVTGLWPKVFAAGPLTVGALIWVGRWALQGFVRNLAAIVGKREVYPALSVAAEGMEEAAARITRGAAATMRHPPEDGAADQ